MNRVLVIEDDLHFCELVEHELRQNGFEVVAAHSLKEGKEKLSSETPDAIVLDLNLPDSLPDRTVEALKLCSNSPIIVLTGMRGEMTAKKAIMDSASGFINKDKGLKYIGTEIRNSIASFSKMQERKTAEHVVRKLQ